MDTNKHPLGLHFVLSFVGVTMHRKVESAATAKRVEGNVLHLFPNEDTKLC